MSHIVRDRLWDGLTDIDGHNPHAIQGFQIPNKEQFAGGITKDYLDLTDHLGVIPEELAYQRYACPLLGGDMTVENWSGEINDFTETHPDMIPPNRQQECPPITIGKAGTLDAKLRCGSIIVKPPEVDNDEELKEFLNGVIEGNLTLIYNFGDYDDPRAPIAEYVLEIQYDSTYNLPNTPKNRVGRIVVMVTLTEDGERDLRALVQRVRDDPHCKGMHISDPVGYREMTQDVQKPVSRIVTWFEIMLVDSVPEPNRMKVSGATYDDEYDAFIFNHPEWIHPDMDIPAERIVASVPINTLDAVKPRNVVYAVVPIWDYERRTVEFNQQTGTVICMLSFYCFDGQQIVSIQVPILLRGRIDPTPIRFFQIFPLAGAPAQRRGNWNQDDYVPENLNLRSTPMLLFGPGNNVLSPVRIEAYLESGRHFRWRAGREDSLLVYDSEWTGTTPLTALSDEDRVNYKGQWKPGVSMIKVTASSDNVTGSTLIPWMGVPELDENVDHLDVHWADLDPYQPDLVVEQEGRSTAGIVCEGGYTQSKINYQYILPKDFPNDEDKLKCEVNLDDEQSIISGTPPEGSDDTYSISIRFDDGWNTVTTDEKELTITQEA